MAGCAITDVICELWPSKMIRVADRGLREGMLMGLMQQRQKLNMPSETAPIKKSKKSSKSDG